MLMVFWLRMMFCGIGVRLDLDLKPMPLRGHGVFRAVKSFNDVSIDGAYGFAAYDNGLVYGNTLG